MDKSTEIINKALSEGVNQLVGRIKEEVCQETAKAFKDEIFKAIEFLNIFFETSDGSYGFVYNRMAVFKPNGNKDKILWRYEEKGDFENIFNCKNSEISRLINAKIDSRMKLFYESLFRRKIEDAELNIRRQMK